MTLASGAQLGPYVIDSLVGAGGMGVVYRAFDSRLRRPVAIKCIQSADGADVSRRVLMEARSSSALNHPNICTVHDVAEHGDVSFIVMEFVDGRPLSALIAEGTPPPAVALNMAVQIASALAHSHERNVVHGDLKAANVIVAESGHVKVVDFGLARRFDAPDDTTELSFSGGTPHAMAPEQLRGGKADSRSDVWSLGVLIQEIVSGTRPFKAASVAELMAAILGGQATAPPAHVAPGVRRIIDRCLTRDPARRYQTAGEVLAALDALSGAQVPVAAGSEGSTEWILPRPPALTALGASQIVLVGREEEWAQLRSAWERAKAGRRQLALVAGDPGIGKTRLVMEFARAIAPDATVLLGRCDQEALVPQQPFVEALEWYARECPPGVLEDQLADIDGVWELAQLIAPIARRVPRASAPIESNPEGRRYRLFEAVAALVSAIARPRPLLIVLEDLHWADRPTLLLLRHLLRSSHEAPLCIVATYRETDLGRTHPLPEMLAELRREEGVTRIELRGLQEDQVREFVGHWIGAQSPSSLTHVVADSTEGNPFFLSEMLRHLDETGALARATTGDIRTRDDLGALPDGVRQAISGRLTRLSDECNRVLSLAAVVGREFPLPVLAALTGTSEDHLFDVVEEALAARLVQDVPGKPDRYAFTHALVRDTLYEELIPARRSRLHRQVAETLDRLAPPGDRPLADLAHHYAHAATAADADKAIECAVGAAERAAATFALEEAARFYDIALKALDLLPQDASVNSRRFELRFRRGRVFADLGLWGPARIELEAALPLVDPGDTTRRVEVLLELSKCTFWLLDVPAVRRYANQALPLAESLGRDDLVADAMSWLGGVLNAEGDVIAAAEMDSRAMERVGGPKTFGLARSVITLYHMGRIDDAIARAFQALESARTSHDPNFRVYALQHLAISLTGAGRYAEAQRAFDEMREFGRRHGVLPMLARGIAMAAGIHIALGNYARGEELSLEARELARRIGFPPPFVSAGIDLLLVFARSGDPGRADAIVDDVARAVVAGSGWHGWLWRLRLSQARAELAVARGDWQSAIAAATEGIVDSEARSRPKYVALGLLTRAAARKGMGETPQAIDDAARAVAVARAVGDPAVLLKALNVQIDVDGHDDLVREAHACTDRILSHLDDPVIRERFLRSDLSRVSSRRQ